MAGEEHPLAPSRPANSKAPASASPGVAAVAQPLPEQQPPQPPTGEGERERRRQTSRLYAELGALLPNLPARANRVRILDEAIAYVGKLRGTVAELEAHVALSGLAGPRRPAAGEVLAAGKASCFAVRLPRTRRRPGALTRVLDVFRRHGVPVLAATVTTDAVGEATVTVTTAAVAPKILEGVKADISSSIA